MTAFEVIDQIKSLPPDERAKVVGYIHEMESSGTESAPDTDSFDKSARKVFDRHAELMQKLSE